LDIKDLFFKNKGAKQTIAKNAFWLTLSMSLSSIASVFVSIWVARHFGPAEYGKWGFVLGFVAFFSVFIEFGFETFIVREVAKDKEKTSFYIDNIIAIKAILSLITLMAMFIVIYFFSKDPVVIKLVYILGPYIILSSFATFFLAIFRANEMMEYETLCYFINAVALVLLKGNSIIYIGYAYVIDSIIAIGATIFFLRKYFAKFYLKINFDACKKILVSSWPYAASSMIVAFYAVDPIILGIFKPSEQVGWYTAAYKVPFFVQMIGLIIWRSFFPKLSQKHKEGPEATKKIVQVLAKIMHFLAWPLAMGGTILAGQIIVFLFGAQYLPGEFAFQMLIWATAVSFLVSIYQEPIKASDKPKIYLYGVLMGAVLGVVLDFLLIPFFGMNGAAMAQVTVQVGVMIYMQFHFSKITHIGIISNSIIPIFAATLMVLAIYFYLGHFQVLIAISLAVLVYLLTYYTTYLSVNYILRGKTSINIFKDS
jgi:O-antigen/teichoic acid export membrane protein